MVSNTYTAVLQAVLIVPGPNRTVEAIIRESVLINIFRETHLTLEKNLVLSYLSTHHSDPDMTEMYEALRRHMDMYSPFAFDSTRKSAHKLPDAFMKGHAALKKTGTSTTQADGITVEDGEEGEEGEPQEQGEEPADDEEPEQDVDDEIHPEAEDISMELNDL